MCRTCAKLDARGVHHAVLRKVHTIVASRPTLVYDSSRPDASAFHDDH